MNVSAFILKFILKNFGIKNIFDTFIFKTFAIKY